MSAIHLVDDSATMLMSMEMLLKRAGYTVTKSESAEAAMTALESISPKLIITDLNMPGMNGIELLREARSACPDAMRILLTGYADLNAQPANEEYGELFPTNSNIDIKIASLPIKDISELVQNTMQGAVTNPEMMSMAGISLMFKVPLMLSQSGTTIEINDNFISNDEYKFSINGAAKADMNAVNSATAKAQARFLGLDKVLAKAQVLGANPNTKNADAFRAISANLELLKKIAIVESGAPGPYGTFAHIFNLLMDPQGKITINGKTLQEAMQGEPAQ